MNIPDELLSAYLDGRLEDSDRARIEQAIASDARLAQRVARQRALRDRRHGRVALLRREPPAQRLLGTHRLAQAGGTAQIIDLARVRAARTRRAEHPTAAPSRSLVLLGGLLAGLSVGVFIARLTDSGALTRYTQGHVQARGVLARALENQLAASGSGHTGVQIGMTFRTADGAYCRTFSVGPARTITGLACRSQRRWQMVTLLQSAPAATAGAGASPNSLPADPPLPALLLQAVQARIAGRPLSPADEARARDGGWH